MERPFDNAAMLHFIRDSLFRTDSPLHHKFSISLETFIAERIASRESKWFPYLSRDLQSCSQKLADTQAKVIEWEQRIDALQTTAASATAATDHRVDTLHCSTQNATPGAVSELQRVEHELSSAMPFSMNLYEFQADNLQTTSSFHNHNYSYNHCHRLLQINRHMHRRAVHLILHNNHLHNHLSPTHILRTSLQSSMLQQKRFWDVALNA